MRRLACALLLGLAVACEPKCLKGHVEARLVAGHFEDDGFDMPVGDISIHIANEVWVPAHYVDVFVCDQYQVEKPEKS
jgi:hypothetical protein